MIEDGDFVSVLQSSFAAFVVEHDDVVGDLLLVVHDSLRAALAEGLDDLGGLRTRSATRLGGENAVAAASGAELVSHDSLSVMKTRGCPVIAGGGLQGRSGCFRSGLCLLSNKHRADHQKYN
jgi:hypothetical protein